jgi:hypothetical protein
MPPTSSAIIVATFGGGLDGLALCDFVRLGIDAKLQPRDLGGVTFPLFACD